MWKYRKRTYKMCLLIVMLFTTVIATTAQELCEELASEVFEETDTNCAGSETENACYGFDSVDATFFEDIGNVFTAPSDLVEMLQVQTLRSSAFNAEEEEWGIGYFRIDIEGSDEPLIIMMAGDVIVENDLETAVEAELSAMQAFNFTTGGLSDCAATPNAVIIQGPENTSLDLVINGIEMRISSTIIVGTIDENENDTQTQDDTMWVTVLEGQVVTNTGTEDEVAIGEGEISTVPLTDENGNVPAGDNVLSSQLIPVINPVTGEPVIGINGEPFYRQVPYQAFETPQPLTESGSGIFSIQNYGFINNVPPTLLNYEVIIPEAETEPVVQNTSAPVVTTPIVATEEPIMSVVDEAVTECGTRNWCNAGEPWGDGRCNDPDPDVSAWYWNSGWYHAQQECGAIETIPETFELAEQAELPVEPTAVVYPGTACAQYDGVGGAPGSRFVIFGGGNFVPAGTQTKPFGGCTGSDNGALAYDVVYAATQPIAAALCEINGAPTNSQVLGPGVTDVWECR